MQEDFHYYATYCAAFLAGYDAEESARIAYSAQFVDYCSRTLLSKVRGPLNAATTQLQGELAKARTDIVGLQDMTRIWASFHFLPYDLYAPVKALSPLYKAKYRLICRPNSDLMVKTVRLAKDYDLESVGVAMHVLADTWAHSYFAGTPSQVINSTNFEFYEVLSTAPKEERRITFRHTPSAADDPDHSIYVSSLSSGSENSIMNLGHGRAGHLPDYSFMRYEYLPAWGNYESILKDNPSDYMHAFRQMVAAMQYLRGTRETFEKEQYETEAVSAWEEKLRGVFEKRQLDACPDWKALSAEITGTELDTFSIETFQKEYIEAGEAEKNDTFLGRFTRASMRQKSMVTKSIFASGSMLAGFAVEYKRHGLRGIRDFYRLAGDAEKGGGK